MNAPRLSVCIPVYNFGAFLAQTLDSILPQLTPEVEILVVDGASTDNTPKVVAERASRYPQLRYVRLERRGGIDADLATSVELAQGQYCWLFSGDDIMRDDAIRRALIRLETEYDVYLCRHTNCDKSMHYLRDHPIFRRGGPRSADLADGKQRRSWLTDAVTTEAMFSFMSGLMVKRERWVSVEPPMQFRHSCWAHVARLLSLAQSHLSVCYVDEIWLDKRGENDSFSDRGVVHRFKIAIDGFLGIATHFYGADSDEVSEVKRLLRNELTLLAFLFARDRSIESPARENRAELDRLFNICYASFGLKNWFSRLVYERLPVSWYHGLKKVYKKLLPSSLRLFLHLASGKSRS